MDDVAGFAAVDAAPDAAYFIRFVDEANRFPSVQECKRKLRDWLRLQPGERVLEVGCAAGDDARGLAQIVGKSGRVTAIDLSEAMVAESRRRGTGSFDNIEFRQADVQKLPFADASFDAIRIERVLMHVPDAARATRELARVLATGGRIAIFEMDWDALVIPHPDRALTRRVVLGMSDALANGQIGRQLPGLLRAAGLSEVTISPHTNLPSLEFFKQLAEGATAALASAGVISASEGAVWWRQLEEVNRRGDFFCGWTGYVVAARKR